ncbi:hypothetical protein AMATHDRAFT_52684 [Amanita thiersii Skay4041]|uniref:Uncharacterized protein n=1 Tax=Amanita thiersii Skay4041 TaxID=703135 RepID=A0A2A9P110_9AGAR|nr:hypothetical protein AMATHDRAFT_52684 [Amanita thiersii Skay4041]
MSFKDAKDVPFTFGVRLGIVFIIQSASLSLLAVTALLLYIVWTSNLFRRSPPARNVRSHIHYYFVNLLISDLIQAIGGIINIKWVKDATVLAGPLCTAQGILKQVGDVGVALTTTVIAIHTVCVLAFLWHPPHKIVAMSILFIWTFISLAVGLGVASHRSQPYYGPTQYWCWITSSFDAERLWLEYFWMYLAAFVNLICYATIALVIKGVIVFDGLKVRIPRKEDRVDHIIATLVETDARQSSAIASQMLLYPAVYIITVSPIAVVRWMAFSGKTVPFAATACAGIVFSSSGLFNVILYTKTRPKLLASRRFMARTTLRLPTEDRNFDLARNVQTRSEHGDTKRLWTELPQLPSRTVPHEV